MHRKTKYSIIIYVIILHYILYIKDIYLKLDIIQKTKNLYKNLIKKLDPLKKLALSGKNARILDKGYLCKTVNNCVG